MSRPKNDLVRPDTESAGPTWVEPVLAVLGRTGAFIAGRLPRAYWPTNSVNSVMPMFSYILRTGS